LRANKQFAWLTIQEQLIFCDFGWRRFAGEGAALEACRPPLTREYPLPRGYAKIRRIFSPEDASTMRSTRHDALAFATLTALLICATIAPARAANPAAFLGAALAAPPPALAGRGIWVRAIAPGSPAERAGLQANDIVVMVDGNRVSDPSSMQNYVDSKNPGDTLTLDVMRWNGGGWSPVQLSATLIARPAAYASAPGAAPGSEAAAPAPAAPAAPNAAALASLAGKSIKWTTFTDPYENAFTVDVPAGWQTQGGMIRRGPLNIDPYLRALSPDRSVYIMLDDPNTPVFATLTPTMAQLGFHEGQAYNPGHVQEIIMHYIPGKQYAREYGLLNFSKLCKNPALESSSDRPDLAAKEQSGPGTRVDGGEVIFTCTHAHAPAKAYVSAVTFFHDQYGIGMWGVSRLRAFIAPASEFDQVLAMLNHMSASVQVNPQWEQEQQQISQATDASIIQEYQHFMATQPREFEARMHQMDQSFARTDDIINGVSHYVDPDTGQRYELTNQYQYQWIGPNGAKVGTNADSPPPGGGWRPLQQVPPQ
jgi:hypothetical protein